ncbi:MAG: HisS family protein, partial [Clostridia bacterium]
MQNNIILPRNLAGFMELLPNEQIAFNKILDSFRAVFETNAFLPMDTPTLELSSVLLAKAGGETEKQVYRFSKGDTDMCMRFDLTVPLAKFVALNSAMLSFPFKRYQIGKSYRGERSQKGRFREFYQCDVDIIGEDQLSIISDAEIIDVLMSALKSIGLSDILVKISNRRLISGFLESLDIDEKSGDVLRLIDKIDKIGMDLFKEEMAAIGLFDKTEKLLEFLSISGNDEETFLKLDNLKIDNQKWNNGLSELKAVFDALKSFGEDKNNYVLDIKTVRGLDYYTGTVFETISKSHPEFGSIGGGGRYENL